MTKKNTKPCRIVSTAQAVKWANNGEEGGSQYKLAEVLDCSRQAINLWGEWPPKARQQHLELLMRANPEGPAEVAA